MDLDAFKEQTEIKYVKTAVGRRVDDETSR